MDDTSSNLKAQNANQTGIPVVPLSQQPVTQGPAPQPITPTGGTKEAPIAPHAPVAEWVAPSTPEIVLPKEVHEAGVEAQPVVPTVPTTAQQAGVQHAKEATPVQSIKAEPLGMNTPSGILEQLKAAHKSVKDSLSWLVRLIVKEQEKKENHTTSGYN